MMAETESGVQDEDYGTEDDVSFTFQNDGQEELRQTEKQKSIANSKEFISK